MTPSTLPHHASNPSARAPALLGAVLLALLAAAGCSRSDAPAAPAASAPASAASVAVAPAATAPAAEPTDPTEKVQTYVQCYNRVDGKAHRSLARYASWVKNMETGPTGSERVVYGLYEIGSDDVAQCQQALTQAAAQKPALAALDAAALEWARTLGALDKTVADAYTYYDRENYKDDNFAHGKQLHAALASQGKAFEAASGVFSRELDLENDKLLAQDLARVEKAEGRKLTYWHMSLMAHAKQLASVVGEENFSADEAAKRLAAYESTADQAMQYGAANKAELPTAWFTIEQAAENYRKAAKQRLRRVRDKVPYNDGEKMMLKPGSAWMVEGSPEQLTKTYNELIEASNNLH